MKPPAGEKKDHNKETPIELPGIPHVWEEKSSIPVTFECLFAFIYIALIAAVPIILAYFEVKVTKVHMLQTLALFVWLGGGLYLFTNVLKFSSGHFKMDRSLTLVETIYLMSQIITTVGYGDITPTFPRGQVFIGLYVLVAIFLIADMVSSVATIIIEKAQAFADKVASDAAAKLERSSSKSFGDDPKHDWLVEKDHTASLPVWPLVGSGLTFFFFILMGVLFWHFYPGEDKTWMEATYMSLITLSTVGFGALTANTEGGKVFGAFWMLFGVVALGGFIASFTHFMMCLKQMEEQSPEKDRETFGKVSRELGYELGVDEKDHAAIRIDKYQFMKFGLLHAQLADLDLVRAIEQSFFSLKPDKNGLIDFAELEKLWL